MEKDKHFYHVFIMILFVISFVASFFLAQYSINLGKLTAAASVVLYPMTYFLITLFSERYGKGKIHTLILYAVISLIFVAIFASFASLLSDQTSITALPMVNYQMIFAAIAAFIISQLLHLKIYYFLDNNKSTDFLIAGVIAISADALLFISLGYLGTQSFTEIFQTFLGHFVYSIIAIVIYSLCFAYLIKTVVSTKEKEMKNENRILDALADTKTAKRKPGRPKKETTTPVKRKPGRPKKNQEESK